MYRVSHGRSLKTARTVLKVLRLLAERLGDGPVTAHEMAALLGVSGSTATYLLNSLVEEGFASKDGVPGHQGYLLAGVEEWAQASGAGDELGRLPSSPVLARRLQDALCVLYRQTGQRSYLAGMDRDMIVVLDAKGRQGLGRVPGLGTTIRAEAHCLAVGKVLLAGLGTSQWSEIIGEDQFRAYTPASITEPHLLEAELDLVREQGFAVDMEEFAEGICCVAAPVMAPSGRVVACLGLSVSASRFRACHEQLIGSVTQVARWATGDEQVVPDRPAAGSRAAGQAARPPGSQAPATGGSADVKEADRRETDRRQEVAMRQG